jgi:hypothetical protein
MFPKPGSGRAPHRVRAFLNLGFTITPVTVAIAWAGESYKFGVTHDVPTIFVITAPGQYLLQCRVTLNVNDDLPGGAPPPGSYTLAIERNGTNVSQWQERLVDVPGTAWAYGSGSVIRPHVEDVLELQTNDQIRFIISSANTGATPDTLSGDLIGQLSSCQLHKISG